MKLLRFFTLCVLCLPVSLAFLSSIARAEDVLKTAKAQTQPSQSDRLIQFANDLLTVKVKDAPLKELLQEIARQSGLSIVWSGLLDGEITIEFHQLSLDKGLHRILSHQSFAVNYAQKTPEEGQLIVPRPKKLWIFSNTEKRHPVQTTVVEDAEGGHPLQDVATDITGQQAVLMSEVPWEREDAVNVLGESGRPAAIEPLSVALEDADEDVREAAIYALANIGGDKAARALAVALQDYSTSVREEAIEAIGEIGGESAILILEQALADENESIRDTAAELLTELRTQTR